MAKRRVYEVTLPPGLDLVQGLALVREKAQGVGITLQGDTEAGTFRGKAEGVYRREDTRLRFEVRKKPFFVTWSMIESGLKAVFGEVTKG